MSSKSSKKKIQSCSHDPYNGNGDLSLTKLNNSTKHTQVEGRAKAAIEIEEGNKELSARPELATTMDRLLLDKLAKMGPCTGDTMRNAWHPVLPLHHRAPTLER